MATIEFQKPTKFLINYYNNLDKQSSEAPRSQRSKLNILKVHEIIDSVIRDAKKTKESLNKPMKIKEKVIQFFQNTNTTYEFLQADNSTDLIDDFSQKTSTPNNTIEPSELKNKMNFNESSIINSNKTKMSENKILLNQSFPDKSNMNNLTKLKNKLNQSYTNKTEESQINKSESQIKLEIENLKKMAYEYSQNKEYDNAIQTYDQLIHIDCKNNHEYYCNKGQIYLKLGDLVSAYECLFDATNNNPNDGYLWGEKGFVELNLFKYDDAFHSYTEALRIHPNEIKFIYYIGIVYKHLTLYKEAIRHFDRVIEHAKYKNQAYFYKSLCYLEQNNYKDAEEALSHIRDKYKLASRYKFHKMIIEISHIMSKNVNDIKLYKTKAIYQFQLEDFFSALKTINIAKQLNPNHFDLEMQLYECLILIELKMFPEARELLEKISLNNAKNSKFLLTKSIFDTILLLRIVEDSELYFNKGFCFMKLGLIDNSIIAFQKAIELNKNEPKYYFFKGYALNNLSYYVEANVNFAKAINLGPNTPAFYCYKKINNLCETISKSEKPSSEDYFKIGIEYLKLKKFILANRYFNLAINANKLVDKYLFYNAIALTEIGHHNQALKSLENGKKLNRHEDLSIHQAIIYCNAKCPKKSEKPTLENRKYLYAKSRNYYILSMYELALEGYKKLHETFPLVPEFKEQLEQTVSKMSEELKIRFDFVNDHEEYQVIESNNDNTEEDLESSYIENISILAEEKILDFVV